MIGVSKEAILVYVLCIYYLVQFQKDNNKTRTLFNSGSLSKVNAINPNYTKKLGL